MLPLTLAGLITLCHAILPLPPAPTVIEASAPTKPLVMASRMAATSGPDSLRLLMVPMWLAGSDTTFPADTFLNTLVGPSPYVTLREFYAQQSKGRYTVAVKLLPWQKSTIPHDSLGNNLPNKGAWIDKVAIEAAQHAIDLGINLADYDNDNNGMVDGFAFIVQGNSYQGSGDGTNPTTQQTWFSTPLVVGPYKLERVVQYAEKFRDYPLAVGTVAHEQGHNFFALPDLYDDNYTTDGKDGGLGRWELMSDGDQGLGFSFSTTATGPWKPIGFSAFSRVRMGWITPLEIDTPQEVRLHPGDVAKLWTDPARVRQYLLLENRDRSGVDSILPGAGLLVTRVRPHRLYYNGSSILNRVNADSSDPGVTILEASGEQRIFQAAFTWTYPPLLKDLFGPTAHQLTDDGPVSLQLPDGTPSDAWLRDIHMEGDDVVLRASPSPRLGYNLGYEGLTLGFRNYAVPNILTMVSANTIPRDGRIVAIQSVEMSENPSTCTSIWSKLGTTQMDAPLVSFCDTGIVLNSYSHSAYHILPTPISVKTGDVLYSGQQITSGKAYVNFPVSYHPPLQDSTWFFLPGNQRTHYNYLPAVRLIIEAAPPTTDLATGVTKAFQAHQIANRVHLQGATAGEAIAISLRDLSGRLIWNSNLATDGSGRLKFTLPTLGSGLFVFEARSSVNSARIVVSQP